MRAGDNPATSVAERRARYERISAFLSSLTDGQLRNLVEEAPLSGSGIGGTSSVVEIEGASVFVKRVPLTDRERQPENFMSTANLFQLPACFQYGIGSAGFGVWRELAAHLVTTAWVLDEQCESFPLLYHWRVLSGGSPRQSTPDDRADLNDMVAYWDQSPAVRDRLEAIARSSATVALFLEYIPQTLDEWLTAQVAKEVDGIDSACAMVERRLLSAVSFMNAHDFQHFDAHFRNILTDGRQV